MQYVFTTRTSDIKLGVDLGPCTPSSASGVEVIKTILKCTMRLERVVLTPLSANKVGFRATRSILGKPYASVPLHILANQTENITLSTGEYKMKAP
jgi:hypothetical protein